MIDFNPSYDEQRDQLAGALGSEDNYQRAGQTQNPEGFTPIPLTDYQGYSETVAELPPPDVQVLIADDPILQEAGSGGDSLLGEPLEAGDLVVFVPSELAPAIQAREPFDDDPATQEALQELVEPEPTPEPTP